MIGIELSERTGIDEEAPCPKQSSQTVSWARDNTPVTLADATAVSTDEGPRARTTLEAVSGLKPVFRPDGTGTAGNCCPLKNSAAAL